MINLNEIALEVERDIKEQLARINDHRFLTERAVPARYLRSEEAERIAMLVIERNFEFQPSEFPGYVEMLPDLLAIQVASRDLGGAISEAIKASILGAVMPSVRKMLLAQRPSDTLNNLLDDVDLTISELMNQVSTGRNWQLQSAVTRVREEPTIDGVSKLWAILSTQALEMQHLSNRLDIADPPTAQVAAQAKRRLEEAADHIVNVKAAGELDAFCATLLPNTPVQA